MPTFSNPPEVHKPGSTYSHVAEHRWPGGRRIVVSGQIGVRTNGGIAEGLDAQMEQAWTNLLAIVAACGMKVENIVKVTSFVVPRNAILAARAVRERKLGGHRPASTYLEVAGLASPELLFEVEAEAVEDGT